MHDPEIYTIDEINKMLFGFRDFYAKQESKGLNGQRPQDVFDAGKGPGIDPAEVVYLMMCREIKYLHRNGFTVFGWHWNHENLYGYRNPIIIKYSLCDLSQIYCFTRKNEFLCAAKPVTKCNPMAPESDNPKDMEEIKRQISKQRSLRNQTVKLHQMLGMKAVKVLPWKEIMAEIPNVIETIEKVENEKECVHVSPFLDEDEKMSQDPVSATEETDPDGKAVLVDGKPVIVKGRAVIVTERSPLSLPEGGRFFQDDYKRYEWYQDVEKQCPGALNLEDWGWIYDFERSGFWKSIYSQAGGDPLPRGATCNESFRQSLKTYVQLVRKESLTHEEANYIRQFRKTAPLYRCIRFSSEDEMEISGRVRNEKSICDDEERKAVSVGS